MYTICIKLIRKSSGKSLIRFSSLYISSKIFLILWWKGENWEGKWGCWLGNMSTDDGDDISNIKNCRNTYYGGIFIPTSTRQKWINHVTSEAILETSKVWISNSGLADKKHIAVYYVAYIRGVSFLQTTNISWSSQINFRWTCFTRQMHWIWHVGTIQFNL